MNESAFSTICDMALHLDNLHAVFLQPDQRQMAIAHLKNFNRWTEDQIKEHVATACNQELRRRKLEGIHNDRR